MKANVIIFLVMVAIAFAGCSDVEEPVDMNQGQAGTMTRATDKIQGSTLLYQEGTFKFTLTEKGLYTLGGSLQPFDKVTWKFGKLDGAGKFIEVTDGITRYTTSSIFDYNIKVNAPEGDYVIEAVGQQTKGWGATYQLSVKVTSYEADMLNFCAYREDESQMVYYINVPYTGIKLLGYSELGYNYSFRTFKEKPNSNYAYSNYLIPVYENSLSLANQYSLTAEPGQSHVVFYIFKSQVKGTVPLYSIVEYKLRFGIGGKPLNIEDEKYFSTNNMTSTTNLKNQGIVGYAFPGKY